MVCHFDVTELKQTEKHSIEAKNKAEVSDRLKSAFLANMSHDTYASSQCHRGILEPAGRTDDIAERRDKVTQVTSRRITTRCSNISGYPRRRTFEGSRPERSRSITACSTRQPHARRRACCAQGAGQACRIAFRRPEANAASSGTRTGCCRSSPPINNAAKFTEQGSITLNTAGGDGCSTSRIR